MGILRGAGNAIVPQVAAEFIREFLDSVDDCNWPGRISHVEEKQPDQQPTAGGI